MSEPPHCKPEMESYRDLLLDMGQERELDALLRLIVVRLAARESVALARIWLLDLSGCDECPSEEEKPAREGDVLLLAASEGSPREEGADWSRVDGEFARMTVGERKVGRIAATGEGLMARVADEESWLARPEWAEREGIVGFAGQPLLYRGATLGVLGLFLRQEPCEAEQAWLRMITNHAATAIVNAHSFSEIERLRAKLEAECGYLREEVREANAFGQILGESAALRSVLRQIELVAPTDASVLILGESGTGKELVAREIHERSARKEGPLIKVNCASVPRELFESEFFGHVRGSFTGAIKDRTGRFTLADGGTLFLDEVGEIPLELQSKLLRVLQEGELERVGEDRTRKVDVRVIAATNRDLKAEAKAGRFREDLYYRLNEFPLEVIPLRDRIEDVPLLARHFLQAAAERLRRPLPRLTAANLVELQHYDWPGNVRELQSLIQRAVILAQDGTLRFNLPAPEREVGPAREVVPEEEMRRRERENVIAALEAANWQVGGPKGAASLLGIKPSTLSSRMKKMGVQRP